MRRNAKSEATVLFYLSPHVEGKWVAHCLDFDLVGTGDNPDEAFSELLGTIEVHLEERTKLGPDAAPERPAPKPYWDALEHAVELPAPDMGELRGRAEKSARNRARRLSTAIPKRCRARFIPAGRDLAFV
jgi:predicted RNase H-like HicB family nuclease